MSVTNYLEQQRSISFDAARDNDLDIVLPANNEITLDIDRPWPDAIGEAYIKHPDDSVLRLLLFGHIYSDKVSTLMRALTDYLPIESAEAWKSHGGNTHVVLTLLQDLTPQARIALQAVLGSDPIRELLSLVRVENDCQDPIALFRPRY